MTMDLTPISGVVLPGRGGSTAEGSGSDIPVIAGSVCAASALSLLVGAACYASKSSRPAQQPPADVEANEQPGSTVTEANQLTITKKEDAGAWTVKGAASTDLSVTQEVSIYI